MMPDNESNSTWHNIDNINLILKVKDAIVNRFANNLPYIKWCQAR